MPFFLKYLKVAFNTCLLPFDSNLIPMYFSHRSTLLLILSLPPGQIIINHSSFPKCVLCFCPCAFDLLEQSNFLSYLISYQNLHHCSRSPLPPPNISRSLWLEMSAIKTGVCGSAFMICAISLQFVYMWEMWYHREELRLHRVRQVLLNQFCNLEPFTQTLESLVSSSRK